MRYNVVVGMMVMATLVFSPACNKKGNQSMGKKDSGIPELSKKTSSDTGDIFKEFYSDDTSGQGASKKTGGKSGSKSHTFSPSPSSAPTSASSAEFVENGRYVVQVACVQSKSFAEKMVGTLKEKNFPAYSAEVQNPTPVLSGTFYRVRIGRFGGHTAAKAFGENTLKPAGYDYWVDKKSNDNTGMEGYGLGKGATEIAPAANSPAAPASSWSSPAPEPAGSPSSSFFGQSEYNAPANVATPASSPTPAPVGNAAVASPSSAPAPSPAPTVSPAPTSSVTPAPAPSAPPAAKAPAPPSTTKTPPAPAPATQGKAPAGTNVGTAPETNDWGTDSAATTPSSSGW